LLAKIWIKLVEAATAQTVTGTSKWKMAPLPRGASYPEDEYNVLNLWQFNESALLPTNLFACAGEAVERTIDGFRWETINIEDCQAV
jgi:hypothetical protein